MLYGKDATSRLSNFSEPLPNYSTLLQPEASKRFKSTFRWGLKKPAYQLFSNDESMKKANKLTFLGLM
jgi:hypothetical protein